MKNHAAGIIMNLRNLVLLVSFAILTVNCARWTFYSFYAQEQPPVWNEDTKATGPFARAFYWRCDSVHVWADIVIARETILLGPPLLPVIPLGFYSTPSDTFDFRLWVSYGQDSSFIEFPDIAIRIDSSSELVSPAYTFLPHLPRKAIGASRWRECWGDIEYGYKFRIPGPRPNLIQVCFLKPYKGCRIPTLVYIHRSNSEYEPFALHPGG